ncbi:MAG: hypothetical protein H0V47_14530 [Chloroflexia bacterium]|nr:hypothetical protein [Chloroflexia bacterium]
MRQDVRDHFFYLRRRVEDYPDAGRPVPRWTDLDYQTVSLLLDELGTLQRFYQDTLPELRARGVPVVLRPEDREESVYDTFQPRERSRNLGVLLFGIGLFIGIYGREMWVMLG